jgi:hypothetical protein
LHLESWTRIRIKPMQIQTTYRYRYRCLNIERSKFVATYYESCLFVHTRDAPDTVFAGYPANPKAGYRISGRILGVTTIFLIKYQIKFINQL